MPCMNVRLQGISRHSSSIFARLKSISSFGQTATLKAPDLCNAIVAMRSFGSRYGAEPRSNGPLLGREHNRRHQTQHLTISGVVGVVLAISQRGPTPFPSPP